MSEAGDRCTLCGDEALPAVVRSMDAAAASAEVESPSGLQRVALDLIDTVQVGDTVLVHQGFAIARLETR